MAIKTNNSNLVSANATQNGHKGTTISIYQGDTTIATNAPTTNGGISSPARRSEVSPIQSHKTSRIGWQTPQDEIPISHTPEHYYFNQSVKSNTLSASSLHATTTANTTTYQLTFHSSSTNKANTTLSPNNMPRKSSYPQSSAENACNNHHKNLAQNHQKFNHAPMNPSIAPPAMHPAQCNNQFDINIQNNNSKNQSCNYKGILPPQQKTYSSTNGDVHQHNGEPIHNAKDEVRYGKILQSKHAVPGGGFSTAGNGTYDRINANIQFQPITNLDDRTKQNNNNNSKHIINQQQQQLHQHQQQIQNQHSGHHNHVQQPNGHGQCRNGSASNQNLLRTNRYSGGNNGMLGAANNHPMGHVINSLSSPESAYSTGYSTDGTSPGASYTPPEYYINMRTGTHYFPKGVNTLAIEATRYKFGLNKIEEMSPQDPLPNNHRRTESFDFTHNQIAGFGIPDPSFFAAKALQCQNATSLTPANIAAIQNYKGFESPSPRQRCRIRTNPWYSTTETSSSGGGGGTAGLPATCNYLPKKIEIDASSSSSGIKSSSETGASDKNEKNEKSSESESSSSTEVEVIKRNFSPSTIRRRKAAAVANEHSKSENHGGGVHSICPSHLDSDEDATLNEMMGKFDESYVYEKETDILSDSDPTDCPSDLDTGQDAGDECDTDELLDIDFIDNGSIQEIVEKDPYKNTGSCSYFNYHLERRASKMRRSRKQNEDACSSRRRKRLLKTRKKTLEGGKDRHSPVRNSRESRSLGGTPVSLRRNQSVDSRKPSKMSPLTQRSNSLTLTEVHAIRGRFVAIAESEKALLKADLEADVKYKQLIHEAETILVSMKTTALRETPVASPRRVCNPPTNKRVEMLRNCEADLKREVVKHQKPSDFVEQPSDGILVNKRIEVLRSDPVTSAPNSPKNGRFSPRKTHISNFINQNIEPVEANRRSSVSDSQTPNKSPQLQLNGRVFRSPPGSPSHWRRRVRSQSPRSNTIYSDSDSDEDNSRKSQLQRRNSKIRSEAETNGNRKSEFTNDEAVRKMRDLKDDLNNRNIVLKMERMNCFDETDLTNRNVAEGRKPPLMTFRSVDMGNRSSISAYCPQSEPLKRKIYKGSSTFERIKKSLDLESEIPKQAILDKITNLRRERQALKSSTSDINQSTSNTRVEAKPGELDALGAVPSTKHQLILNTIEDLKRSLEDQSVELSGLNDDPEIK
ncbi:unnamed protein product [Hermetia illucens]|uniref:Uncharacterized protein n=1 Tax=Hermetia illucens TaxID=343691 RepID=A0A7R8YMA5_HERIL|nr:unnamed protein product [Hermetia illucens]